VSCAVSVQRCVSRTSPTVFVLVLVVSGSVRAMTVELLWQRILAFSARAEGEPIDDGRSMRDNEHDQRTQDWIIARTVPRRRR